MKPAPFNPDAVCPKCACAKVDVWDLRTMEHLPLGLNVLVLGGHTPLVVRYCTQCGHQWAEARPLEKVIQ